MIDKMCRLGGTFFVSNFIFRFQIVHNLAVYYPLY